MDVTVYMDSLLQGSGNLHGYRLMYDRCLVNGLRARKEDVRLLLGALDPEGVQLRRRSRLRRQRYVASGPNFLWHVDSYDKPTPFGLCINGCIDGFARQLYKL